MRFLTVHLTVLAALLVPAGVMPAQTSAVIPSAAAKTKPNYWNFYPFYGTRSTSQKKEGRAEYLYDTADVPVLGMLIRSLQFRRPNTIGNINRATTFTLTIDISVWANAHSTASSSYAANHGSNKARVFSGKVNLPSRSRSSTWPDPWEAPVLLSKAFPYARPMGKSLVIELAAVNTSGTTVPWYIEATKPATGQRKTESSPTICRHSGGACPCSMSFRFPSVGGVWFTQYNGYPNNTPSFKASVQAVGLQGRGGTFAGMRLPINLSSLRVPASQPSCVLANDIVLTLPLVYVTSSSTSPNRGALRMNNINLPNNPTIGGATFYTQPISLDTNPQTKTPMVHTGWGSKWTVGSGKGAPGTTVYRVANNAATTGFVLRQFVATMRLNP